MTPTIKIRLSDPQLVKRMTPTSKQLSRASRLVINKIVNDVNSDLGGSIPRASGVRIGGFRKVRMRKTKALAKRKIALGKVWIGGNKIKAKFGGVMKNTKTGARAGKHNFKGSFVVNFKSGYKGIFHRNSDGGLVEDTIDVKDMHKLAIKSVARHSAKGSVLLRSELEKILRSKK